MTNDADRSDLETSGTPGGPAQTEQQPGRGQRAGIDPSERSDVEIRDEIATWLAAQDEFDEHRLNVLTSAGIVTLMGNVPDYESKRHIEDFVRAVRGVREVHDQILVERDPISGVQ